MLETVWRRASEAQRIDRLVVATEDDRILEACRAFGAEALATDPGHPSGTDRVAEVARMLGAEHGVVLNIQGDEPLLTPTALDLLVAAFSGGAPPDLATLAEPVRSAEELFDPNVVKVVADASGRALYFSRAPIPYHRAASGALAADFRDALGGRRGGLSGYRRHQGLYAFTREALEQMARLPPSPLELDEGLEQLRALEAGLCIQVIDSDFRSQAVDTPADLERLSRMLTEVR